MPLQPPPKLHRQALCRRRAGQPRRGRVRGPTEDNPSLSIKKRLKRAQFFDQREQLVAAGLAVPVEADAGLPDAVEVPEPAEATREPV